MCRHQYIVGIVRTGVAQIQLDRRAFGHTHRFQAEVQIGAALIGNARHHHEQTVLDVAEQRAPAGEAVVAPGAFEHRRIPGGLGIEIGGFDRIQRVRDVEDAQAGGVVGLVEPAPVHVVVVVDRQRRRIIFSGQRDRVEIAHVEHAQMRA